MGKIGKNTSALTQKNPFLFAFHIEHGQSRTEAWNLDHPHSATFCNVFSRNLPKYKSIADSLIASHQENHVVRELRVIKTTLHSSSFCHWVIEVHVLLNWIFDFHTDILLTEQVVSKNGSFEKIRNLLFSFFRKFLL